MKKYFIIFVIIRHSFFYKIHFLTDGVFDPAKYEQAINNPQGNEWVEIEQFMKNTYIPNYKLQQYIASSVVVTNDEVYNQYIKDNVDYTIEGIHVIGRKLQNEVAQPTDDELYTYYTEHLNEYKKKKHAIFVMPAGKNHRKILIRPEYMKKHLK